MRRRTTVLSIAIFSLLIFVAASEAQAQISWLVEKGPEGSWIGMGAITAPPTLAGMQFPFMDTYTRAVSARTGAVLCQMPVANLEYAGQKMAVAGLGQGNWIRVSKNNYKFTVARLVLDATGQPVALAKFNADVQITDPNTMTGTVTANIYDWNQNLLMTLEGTLQANRIAVEE